MTQALLLTFIGGIIGITSLANSAMAAHVSRATFHWPLGSLQFTIAILVCPPLVAQVAPAYHTSSIAVGLIALMSLGPLLWFYVMALTSESQWRMDRQDLLHFLPAIVAFGICVGFHLLSPLTREAMVLRAQPPDGAFSALLGTLTWLLLLLWVPQSFYYLTRCGRQLLHYRSRIKHTFANIELRELTWLVAFVVVLAAIWLLAIAATVSSNIFNFSLIGREGTTVMALVVTWVLASVGINQRPGYEGHYAVTIPQAEVNAPEKYSRSALDEENSARIATKIEDAMVSRKLYRNADLTLGELANAVGVAPNYVSQTLNETVGESFFDYVNKKRVVDAQTLLRETDKAVLEIAYEVGFNARSSFYKAFRRVTGVTPGDYRQSALASLNSK